MGCGHRYLPPQRAVLHPEAAAISLTSQASRLKLIGENIFWVLSAAHSLRKLLSSPAPVRWEALKGTASKCSTPPQPSGAEDPTQTASLISLLLSLYSKCSAVRGLSYEIIILLWLSATAGLGDVGTLMLQVISSATFGGQSQLSETMLAIIKSFQIRSLLMQ